MPLLSKHYHTSLLRVTRVLKSCRMRRIAWSSCSWVRWISQIAMDTHTGVAVDDRIPVGMGKICASNYQGSIHFSRIDSMAGRRNGGIGKVSWFDRGRDLGEGYLSFAASTGTSISYSDLRDTWHNESQRTTTLDWSNRHGSIYTIEFVSAGMRGRLSVSRG